MTPDGKDMERPGAQASDSGSSGLFDRGLGAVRCPGDQALMARPDRHHDFELNIVEGGELTYLAGKAEVKLRDGELTVFWGAIPHQVTRIDAVRYLTWIHIPMSWIMHWQLPAHFMDALMRGKFLRNTEKVRSETDTALMRQWVDDFTDGRTEQRETATLEIQARVRRLAFETATGGGDGDSTRTAGTRRDSAMALAEYISDHYTRSLHVAEIARSAGLVPGYAMTLFRQTFGMTMIRFLTQHRIWHAQRLLAVTDRKVLAIALDSGFGSLSQFNAAFRAICRMTPREFRRSLRRPPGS